MKTRNKSAIIITLCIIAIATACTKTEIDEEKPNIDLSIVDAFPTNGDTIYFGEPFTLNMNFTDNAELGSYSIDIHNNFDHHSHSTEVTQVVFDSIKQPVNPFSAINDYSIPNNMKEYNPQLVINIPESNSNGKFDEGDYHFFVSLTDKEGWNTSKGLNIKLKYR